jgi:uncharacterized membrane protein YfcA
MDALTSATLIGLIFAAAVLYSSVGHAGASGYLAVMALYGFAPEVMKPTALALNILVATLATIQFYRAGCFEWRVFWPFATTSIPFAFLGGTLSLPGNYYKPLVGLLLLLAASRFFVPSTRTPMERRPLTVWIALLAGAGIGLLSGLTGVGGGVFLSPLLLIAGWAEIRQSSGGTAAFILVNSFAGLLGHLSSVSQIPVQAVGWGIAAIFGGWVGTQLGSQYLNSIRLREILGVVLMIAGLKLILA